MHRPWHLLQPPYIKSRALTEARQSSTSTQYVRSQSTKLHFRRDKKTGSSGRAATGAAAGLFDEAGEEVRQCLVVRFLIARG